MLRCFARTFASSGIFLLFPLFVQAQALSFSVGTATAAPGQKSIGYWSSHFGNGHTSCGGKHPRTVYVVHNALYLLADEVKPDG